MTPLVSVIISTYNRLPLLREAIASVLKQTFNDYELIVVDDGASGFFDENLPVCEDYDYWLRVTLEYPVETLRELFLSKGEGMRTN